MVWHKRYSDGSSRKTADNLLLYYYNDYGDYIMVLNVEGRKRPLGYRLESTAKDRAGHRICLTESKNLKTLQKLCEQCRR